MLMSKLSKRPMKERERERDRDRETDRQTDKGVGLQIDTRSSGERGGGGGEKLGMQGSLFWKRNRIESC